MIRLCLRFLGGAAIVSASFGCAGQNVEGAWFGPLPLEDTKDCRIKIYSDHRFDVACGKLDAVGAGTYEREGSKLTFHFAAWVRRGVMQKTLPQLQLKFVGEGNTMRLGDVNDETTPIVWHRARI